MLPPDLPKLDAELTTEAAGIIAAADRPCTTRKKTIQVCAKDPWGVAPHRADEPANPMMPISTIFLDPTTSASRPPKAKPAASARM